MTNSLYVIVTLTNFIQIQTKVIRKSFLDVACWLTLEARRKGLRHQLEKDRFFFSSLTFSYYFLKRSGLFLVGIPVSFSMAHIRRND